MDKVIRKAPRNTSVQTTIAPSTKLCFEGVGVNRKLVLYKNGVKDCLSLPEGSTGIDCTQLATCPIIVQIQSDIDTIEGDITNINTAITNLQNATSTEALQDAIAPLLAHGNHTGITATYNDTTNQIILTVTGGGSTFTCADVATCISSNQTTQTALLNWLQLLTNVTLQGDWNFDGTTTFNGDVNFDSNTVTFNDTGINFENGTTLNYDSTVLNNHNGDTVNYDGSTINSTNTTYNHTGDTINYDATTTVDGGTFNNNTFNNPTFTGNIGVGIKRVNEQITGGPVGTFTLANIPMGDIQVSTLGGVIQIETSDYTHADNSSTFTTAIDTTGATLVVSYIIGSTGVLTQNSTYTTVTTKTPGTIYQAGPKGGFIVFSVNTNSGARIFSDNNPVPSALMSWAGGAQTTISCPILPNMYYQCVLLSGLSNVCNFYE